MNFLFGRNKKPKNSAPPIKTEEAKPDGKEAIVDLRNKYDLVEKKSKFLQTKINLCRESAKKNASIGNKKQAMIDLKKKKMFEVEIEKYSNVLLNIDRMICTLESSIMNAQIMQAYKTSSTTMKEIQSKTTIDDVDNTMDDLEEAISINEEIGTAISRPVGDIGMDDIEDEFNLLMMEEAILAKPTIPESKIPTIDPLDKLPLPPATIPTKPIPKPVDKEIASLMAEFA